MGKARFKHCQKSFSDITKPNFSRFEFVRVVMLYLELRSLIAAWSLAETTVDLGSPIGCLLMLTLPTSSN